MLAVDVGEPLGEHVDRGIGAAARQVRRRRLAATATRNVHDAPEILLDHRRQHRALRAHIAEKLCLQHGFPVLVGEIEDATERRQRHGIDEDIDPAMPLEDFGGRRIDRVAPRQIGDED